MDGHVRLIILHEEDVIRLLCLNPRKYLLYLGWCILGVEGELALEHNCDGIGTDGDLDDRGIYYYVAQGRFLSLSWMRMEYL
jgi:hypothetical protein